MDLKKPESTPDHELIEYLEQCLALAREGRVLFVIAAVGHVGDGGQFQVAAGGFIGAQSPLFDPHSLRSACDDTSRGAAFAAQQLTAKVQQETEAAMPPKEKAS